MAVSRVDPVTGIHKYNPFVIVGVGVFGTLVAVGVICLLAFGRPSFGPGGGGTSKPGYDRSRLTRITQGGSPSQDARKQNAGDFYDTIGDSLSGQSKAEFLNQLTNPDDSMSNLPNRWLNLFGRSEKAAASGGDAAGGGQAPPAGGGRGSSVGGGRGSSTGGGQGSSTGGGQGSAGGYWAMGSNGELVYRQGVPPASGGHWETDAEGRRFWLGDGAGGHWTMDASGNPVWVKGVPSGDGHWTKTADGRHVWVAGQPSGEGYWEETPDGRRLWVAGQPPSDEGWWEQDADGRRVFKRGKPPGPDDARWVSLPDGSRVLDRRASADGSSLPDFDSIAAGADFSGDGVPVAAVGGVGQVLNRDRLARLANSAAQVSNSVQSSEDVKDREWFASQAGKRSASGSGGSVAVSPMIYGSDGAIDTGKGKSAVERLEEMRQKMLEETRATSPAVPQLPGASSVEDSMPKVAKRRISSNSVPTGTRIPVVLINNVISSTLDQRVWAITAKEVVFRKQVQLPAGVMLGGHVGSTPVRDQVDVTFDLMVFPDGSELRFLGFGVNGYNPMYPGLEGMRGLADKYFEPPLWSEFLPILLEGLAGYADVRFPASAVVSTDAVDQQFDPKTQVYKGINSAAKKMQEKILVYLERYAPYVQLRKGMPFWVEVESTVDFSTRALGAFSYDDLVERVKLDAARSLSKAYGESVPAPNPAAYLGVGGNSTSPSELAEQLRDARRNAVAIGQALGK